MISRRVQYLMDQPMSAKGKAAIRKAQDFWRGFPACVKAVTAPTPLEKFIKEGRCFDV